MKGIVVQRAFVAVTNRGVDEDSLSKKDLKDRFGEWRFLH